MNAELTIAGNDAYRLEIEVAPVYIEAKETNMEKGKLRFTLEYWKDGEWMVGRLREAP